MAFINDNYTDDEVLYIDGTEEELIPGLNDLMAQVFELYVENYMEEGYLDHADENEVISVDLTSLSHDEMSELVKCAAISLEMETADNNTNLLLS